MKHEDVCTHMDNEEDRDILTRKGFDVNMRLFHSSFEYQDIIYDAALYIQKLAMNQHEGYSKPFGFSGANAGIPLNIIALSSGLVMLNPKIIKSSKEKVVALSNCGSLTLPKPIKVERHETVSVQFFDLDGVSHTWNDVTRKNGGFTIQHEVDHNLGILITDRVTNV